MNLGKSGSASLTVAFLILGTTLAVFPAVDNATNAARATAMKNKARGIWIAVVSANTEREIFDMPMLWPLDLEKENNKTFDSAEAYFTHLMSDGKTERIHRDPMERIASDLRPEMVGSPQTKLVAGARTLPPGSSAWHVVCVSDDDPAEMPFLISRNVKVEDIRFPTEAELLKPNAPETRLGLEKKDLSNRVVWITKGGSTMDAVPSRATRARLVPFEKPAGRAELKVLPALDAAP